MIIDTHQGNVFESDLRTIVFAINTEGHNDSGFAGMVGRRFRWDALMNAGPTPLGAILSYTADGYTLHGVCCHSLDGTWSMDAITKALDRIAPAEDAQPIAVVWMGHGLIGMLQGVNSADTRAAIEASKARCYLCHL